MTIKPKACPRTHEYKVWPQFFDSLADGSRPFEVLKDDRNPRPEVGDTLVLREWSAAREYSGRSVVREVTYALRNDLFFIKDYVVLGLRSEPNPDEAKLRDAVVEDCDEILQQFTHKLSIGSIDNILQARIDRATIDQMRARVAALRAQKSHLEAREKKGGRA